MTLHAHTSGYDITFENGEKGEKYRASALIRKYEVHIVENDGKTKEILEERSTYLYDYLNGFPLLGETHIAWKDKDENSEFAIERKKRKNVYKYRKGEDGEYVFDVDKDGKKEKDGRLWSFSKKVDKKP